jgi:L,D-peptidoglycan transpeptidase YkuD (ErfK/YbiS/YcfS/YnhG family)
VRVLAIAAALVCPPQLPAVPGAAQLVTVQAATYRTTTATVRLWRRSGGCWRRVAGPWPARLGANGLSDGKREGDGTTPTGTYGVGATIYGIEADPGVHLRYRRLTCGDWWDEDPGSSTYNTFRHVPCGATPPFGGQSEALWRIRPQYRYFAEIEYNTRPAVPGRGSAIFLHVSAGRPTAGCVSLEERRITVLLRWLRPGAAVHIGIS